MTFNGQQIALRSFSNSYEKMAYADSDHIQKLAFIIVVLDLVMVELMHFMTCIFSYGLQGWMFHKTTQIHMHMHMSIWMEYYGILNFKVL